MKGERGVDEMRECGWWIVAGMGVYAVVGFWRGRGIEWNWPPQLLFCQRHDDDGLTIVFITHTFRTGSDQKSLAKPYELLRVTTGPLDQQLALFLVTPRSPG